MKANDLPADLSFRIENLLLLPEEAKLQAIELFLSQYEQTILNKPFGKDLYALYESLVKVYTYLGELAEKECRYVKAIAWFERSRLIIEHSQILLALFADVFLHLAFCYFKQSRIDFALQHLCTYQLHNTAAQQACVDISKALQHALALYQHASLRNSHTLELFVDNA